MDIRQLFLAHISEVDEGLPNGRLNMLYVVLAASEGEASEAILRARRPGCTIEFRPHSLKKDDVVKRLALQDGVARPLN